MTTETKTYELSAKNRPLGRVASEAASILLGKRTVSAVKHAVPEVKVLITDAAKLSIGEKKRKQKTYTRYSGYPGGLKEETLARVLERKGHAEVLRRAVAGMLPKNRLHKGRMKRLTITD